MIKNISWVNYWTAIGTILIFYYVLICFKYYLAEIKEILSGKSQWVFKKKKYSNSSNLKNNNTHRRDNNVDENHSVEPELLNDLINEKSSQQGLFPEGNQLIQENKNDV